MEAVRRKQTKKARNKAKTTNGNHAAAASASDTTAVSTAAVVANGSAHANGNGAANLVDGVDAVTASHSSEEEAWELDADDDVAAASTRPVDDEIAQHEDDIMELLGGTATTLRIPTVSSSVGSLQGDVGTMTAAAAPSAPDFDDSDDEDAKLAVKKSPVLQAMPLPTMPPLPAVQDAPLATAPGPTAPPAPTAPEAAVVTPSAPSAPVETPTVDGEVAASRFRPSAPDNPSDSPLIPANRGLAAASVMPSAPLEEEDVEEDLDGLSRAHALRTKAPTAPTLLQEENVVKPTVITESSAPELAREASLRDPTAAQGRRLRISVPDNRVEKAGETVRTSIAKLRAIDVSNRLYPTVLQSQATTSDDTTVRSRTQFTSPAEKHPVYIKLEPHSNFEMNLLRAAASQKRQEAKMHNIEINKGDLYGRLERYLYAEYLLHTASTTLEARKKEADAMVQKVWLLEMKRLSSAKKCGDQIDIEEVLEFQTARFDAAQHAKLKAQLESIRQLRTVEASLHTFDRALSYFHVEQYINEVIQEPAFVSYLNKMSAATNAARTKSNNFGEFDVVPETISFYEALPTGSTLASSVEHLKYCIDVMIFFEKKVTVDDQGLFGRVPSSFARGELVWQSSSTGRPTNGGTERKVKCYACNTLNAPMEPNHWCKFCASCGVVLFLPPSSVSNKSNDWYTSVLRFRQSLQKWISLSLRTLLRLRSLVNMPYLLMHVMYLPRISTEERSWILRFLQFPKAVVTLAGTVRESWSEDLVDHYVAMLHLVFHPEKLRRLTTLVSSELPTRHKGSKERKGDASLEWVLLENPEMLDRCYLSDEDFVSVMNQFPHTFAFEQLFSCTMDTKKCFSRALALVIEFTQGLRLFQEFEKFPARVAQLLGELLLNASMVTAASSSTNASGEGFFYPTLFDQLFLTALHGLLVADCNRVAWRSIRTFPFAPLSALAKWDVLGLLLFGISNVPGVAKSAAGWNQFIDKASVGRVDKLKPARMVLHDQIISDPDNAMHLMHAVARLAASAKSEDDASVARDLVLVTTQELFLAGFASTDCRQALGESGERAAGPISTICLAHPWVISELIALLFKYHECAETWIHVFETFPVNRWLPTPADLTNLQEWLLLDDTSSPRSALARFLLDRINWEFDVKAGQLFTSAFLHRQVALVVAEAMLVHRNRRKHGVRDASTRQTNGDGMISPPKLKSFTKSIRRVFRLERPIDFEQWCWKLMLKLKFYSPRTHQPFVELVDLRHDRSREALLLRRWFPGGAGSAVVGAVSSIRFFESYDQQLNPFGSQGGSASVTTSVHEEFSHRAALVGTGSSGAPIQDESAIATTEDGESSNLTESAELVSSVTVTSTCDVEPIVAYLICQATTFVFCERMDRWEPLLVLLKNGFFPAGVKVLENVLPLMAKLDRVARSRTANGDGGAADSSKDVDHALSVCMATMENFSTDQLLQLVQAMEQHSFISLDECQLLSDVLQKGYIGGWESTAKAKVIAKLRFVRECSSFIHPLVLPSLINESFPQSSSSSAAMISTAAMLQGAMSWLTSALRGGHTDPPSPSAANSIASALTIRKSHLVATVPTAASTPAVTAAAAAASLGIVDAPGDYTTATQQLCNLIERAFEVSTTTALLEIVSFWAKTVLQVPLWFEHPALRHILDVLLRCSMRAYYASVSAKKIGSSAAGSRSGVHLQLVAILRSAFGRYCVEMKRAAEKESSDSRGFDGDLPAVVSFLPAISSVPALASIFGGNADPAQFIGGCSAFAFWTLLVEVRQELPLFRAMGQVLIKYEPAAMKKVEKFKKTESKLALELGDVGLVGATNRLFSLLYAHVSMESLSQFKIYRFAAYCLQMREDDELQILFWQVFFALYFASAGGTRVFGHYFLDREESSNPSHTELRKLLQEKLRAMTTFCSNQAQVVLTVSGGSATGNLTSEGKELKYHHFVQLSHIYTAMDAWLEESDPNKWLNDDELATLPRHFEVTRLKEVLAMSGRLLNTTPEEKTKTVWESLPLWMELCGFEFHTRVLQSGQPQGDDDENGEQGETMPAMTAMDHLQEEDFAFIEDHDMRRFSSLGSSADHGRTTNPLQLTSEYVGPASLTVLPQVTIETLPDRCSVTPSIPLNKHALKTLATKFSETLSILVGLDAEILDHVSKLYVSKSRIITESKACLEGTNCRKPAAFRFEFQEWAMDKQLMDTVQSTVTQAERYEMRSMCQHSATSSSLANLLLGSEHRRSESSLLPEGVDEFLRLDADNLMLSMQILLIDQVVQVLQVDSEKLKRAVVVAQATAAENPPPQEDVKPLKQDGEEAEGAEGDDEEEKKRKEKFDLDAKAVRDAERQVERLHEKGLEWFRLLTELDTKLARMVPPLREVLWRSIKQLGIAFVCVDERETCNLLHLMLEDPSRITLLSECFAPASAPARFVEMFSNLMSASSSSKLTNEEKLVLLQRFDFTAWLSSKPPHTPTKFDRETVLCIVLGDIGANFSGTDQREPEIIESYASRVRAVNARPASGNDEEQVLRLYAKIIHQICGAHLDDHLEKVLHALVGVHDDYRFSNTAGSGVLGDGADGGSGSGGARMPRPAPAIVWEAIVSIPASVWQQLPFVQTEACVTFLSQHMTTMRWQASMNEDAAKGMHFLGMWQRNGALKSYLDLFSQLSRTTPEQHKWTMISTFFEPLLTTLYQPASTTESSTVSCPWTESDALTTGTTLCSCFVAICTDFLKARPKAATDPADANAIADRRSASPANQSSKEKLDLVWSFYLNTLIPHAPVHVCKSFHQFLTRLGWEHWCLTIDIVHQMREVVQNERQQLTVSASVSNLRDASATSSPYPFVSWMVRDVLCRLTWKSTEDWLATQTEAVRSVFLGELGKLCIDLVLDIPHFQPPQPRSKNGRGSTPSASSSSNVLPPYFVNFIKQQSSLWFKWKMNEAELESFLSYTFDAVMEPIGDLHRGDDTAVFPSNPSVAVMQDAFLRLQLVLRRVSQVTTLNHSTMSKRDCLKRANLFFKMAFTIFTNGMTSVSSAGEYSAIDPSAWVTVLFGATCTVLFEKLDEIVQLSRAASEPPSSTTAASPDDSVTEEDLQGTVVEVLRLFNLRLVEGFFKREQHSDSTLSSNALAWGKCGNVIFVEVDSLIRDFSATHKQNVHSRNLIAVENAASGDDPVSGNGSSAIKQPTSVVESIGNPLGRLLWSFMGFRGGELCCLSACGRAIASVHVMSVVAERSIEKWIIEERRGSWEDLVSRLRIPELSEDEFEGACLQQGHLLTLQLLFLQQLKKAPAMTEAFAMGMLSKLMTWMEKLHLIGSTTALMEMKMLFLAAEVTNFVYRSLADVLPSNHKKQMLRELCNIMLRFGNARRQHGIMKAIGIGGSLKYNVEFHVCSLTIGVFLRLQTRNGAPLRVDDRIPYKLTRTTEKHIKSLEQLLASKNCFQLQKRMEWMVDFLKSPSRSLADQDEFFVSLFSRIYPSHPWMLAQCINT